MFAPVAPKSPETALKALPDRPRHRRHHASVGSQPSQPADRQSLRHLQDSGRDRPARAGHNYPPPRPERRTDQGSRHALCHRPITCVAWCPLRRLPYDRRYRATTTRHPAAAAPRMRLGREHMGAVRFKIYDTACEASICWSKSGSRLGHTVQAFCGCAHGRTPDLQAWLYPGECSPATGNPELFAARGLQPRTGASYLGRAYANRGPRGGGEMRACR